MSSNDSSAQGGSSTRSDQRRDQLTAKNGDLIVTNPLTESTLTVRGVVSELFSSAELECLNALQNRSLTLSELADQVSVSRQTIDGYCSSFANRGWIKRMDMSYSLTAAGAIIHRVAKNCLTDVTKDDLSWLSNASVKLRLVRLLKAKPLPPATVVREIDELSRPRLNQLQTALETRGWLSRSRGKLRLTRSGLNILETYDRLFDIIKQIIRYSPTLYNLGPECKGLPLLHLAGSKQYVWKTGSASWQAIRKFDQLLSADFDRCCAFCSFYEVGYSESSASAIKSGSQMEIVCTPNVLTELPYTNPSEWEAVKTQLLSNNYQARVYPGQLPAGLAVFDENLAVLGSADPTIADPNDHGVSGMILVKDNTVIEWMIDLYQSYRRKASLLPRVDS